MRLVEAITRELLGLIEDLFGQVRRNVSFPRAPDEFGAMPRSAAPDRNFLRWGIISAGIFLPMARRRMSASPMV